MSRYQLVYYELENGRSPVREFIDAQNRKMRARIAFTERLLEENGPFIRMPYSRPLGDGLFELRIQSGNDIARVLYFLCKEHTIVLTNGFVKKTQKTPAAEIRLAKNYREDYERRVHHDI